MLEIRYTVDPPFHLNMRGILLGIHGYALIHSFENHLESIMELHLGMDDKGYWDIAELVELLLRILVNGVGGIDPKNLPPASTISAPV